MFRKKGDFMPRPLSSIFMKRCKGENTFIKDKITRDIYSTRRDIKTLKSLVKRAITKKSTSL
jgi:hypothetical protein